MSSHKTSKRGHDTTGESLLCTEGRILAGHLVGWKCPVCGRKMKRHAVIAEERLTIDHYVAHHAGGAVIGNLLVLCGSCNSSKQDRPMSEWLVDRIMDLEKKSRRGAKVARTARLPKLEATRDELTAALIAAEIW